MYSRGLILGQLAGCQTRAVGQSEKVLSELSGCRALSVLGPAILSGCQTRAQHSAEAADAHGSDMMICMQYKQMPTQHAKAAQSSGLFAGAVSPDSTSRAHSRPDDSGR